MPTRARQPNKYLGAYDQPILRDTMFWVLIGLITLAFVALISPTDGDQRTTGLPLWLDSLLGAFLMGVLFGYPIALIRRIIRASRIRRSGSSSDDSDHLIRHPAPIDTSSDLPTSPYEQDISDIPSFKIPPPLPFSHESSRSGELVSESSVLSQARDSLPFPIARTARSLQITRDPIEQYTLLLELAESISISVATVAAAWLNQNEPDNPQLQALYQALSRGVSQGAWHSIIPAAARSMANSEFPIPGYCQGVGKSKKTADLVSILRPVVEECNRWAHGARPTNKGDATIRVEELVVHLDLAIRKISFLQQSPWILVRDTNFDRRRKLFVANVGLAMSDHPEFAPSSISTSTPLAEDTLYVDADGRFIDLTPLIVYKYCAHCRQPEMFYADRSDRGRAVLKSFARGHQTFDEEIFEEIQQLINRPTA